MLKKLFYQNIILEILRTNIFYSALFYFILFYFILFYFILFFINNIKYYIKKSKNGITKITYEIC